MIATAVENAEADGTCAEVLRMVAAKERGVCPASSFQRSLGACMAHVARSSSWNRVLKTCQTSGSSFKKVVWTKKRCETIVAVRLHELHTMQVVMKLIKEGTHDYDSARWAKPACLSVRKVRIIVIDCCVLREGGKMAEVDGLKCWYWGNHSSTDYYRNRLPPHSRLMTKALHHRY